MSYSITAYLFFGVPLTDDQAEKLEETQLPKGIELLHVGCAFTGEGSQSYLCCYVRECDQWVLPLSEDALGKKLIERRKTALGAMLSEHKIETSPAWFLGRMGG